MKKRCCFILCILLVTCTTFGCTYTRTARLYPVQGPLSTQTPSPVFFVKFTVRPRAIAPAGYSALFSSADLSVVLSGEVYNGRWNLAPPIEVPKGATTAYVPATAGMSSVWDIVYGSGFYVAHVLGSRLYSQAVISGNRGTVLNVEMYQPGDGVGPIKGVARDNNGNIYKLVW